eukprot:5837095-Pleurochrysis_carterae.AAC.3
MLVPREALSGTHLAKLQLNVSLCPHATQESLEARAGEADGNDEGVGAHASLPVHLLARHLASRL